METNEPVAPMTPPTDPVPIQRAPRGSSWPGAVGTISIIFGALGIVGGVLAFLGPLMMSWMEKVGGQEAADVLAAMKKWEWWTYLSAVLSMGIAALLLAGGIWLVRRRAKSRSLLLTWAALKLVYGVIGTGLSGFIQYDIQTSTPQTPGLGPGFMMGIVLFSSLLGFLWVAALPIFMLIWLTRPKIRAEISSWGTPNARSV